MTKPIIMDKRTLITVNLFLGSQYSLVGLQKLKALGVTAIVNMREPRYSKNCNTRVFITYICRQWIIRRRRWTP